jgi:hypothetical protein
LSTYTETIIGTYAPVKGTAAETEEFYHESQAVNDKINNNDYLTMAGDFNVRDGAQPVDKHIR